MRVEGEIGSPASGRVGTWHVLSVREGPEGVLWPEFYRDFCTSFIFSLGPSLFCARISGDPFKLAH